MDRSPSHSKRLAGKKALVMGIGLHGGGVATAKWLAKEGARVIATDMRDASVLAPSLAALEGIDIGFVLGRHRKSDFAKTDIVVVNPGVPNESPYLAHARAKGRAIENDASLFFKNDAHRKIAVTGTRGKTTTTLFIAELLKGRYPEVRPSGNTPNNALLKEFERIRRKDVPVVAELSSWQLEHLSGTTGGPDIAVITNLYPDHLNRYGGIEAYASAKANIFRYQRSSDSLILNKDNPWTRYFLRQKPPSKVYLFSKRPLKTKEEGAFVSQGELVVMLDGRKRLVLPISRFVASHGTHNLENLMPAVLGATLLDPSVRIVERDILALPTPPMRQEVIHLDRRLLVINDSCATSPDGTIAAIERFSKEGELFLILGGTDKALDFSSLARTIAKGFDPEHIALLSGSATTRLLALLPRRFSSSVRDTLGECVTLSFDRASSSSARKRTILFSPGAASFEKFLHEFDRGKRFERLVRRAISRGRKRPR